MTEIVAERTDHELMRLVRARVNSGQPMTAIAGELGWDVDDLCAWIMAYREPKRNKPYVNRQSPAQIATRDFAGDATRFANWRRAKNAAAAALSGLKP